MGKNIGKNISKKLSSIYNQNVLDNAKQSARYLIKTYSQKHIKKRQKQPMIWLVIKFLIKLWKPATVKSVTENIKSDVEIPRERHISAEKWQRFIDDLS